MEAMGKGDRMTAGIKISLGEFKGIAQCFETMQRAGAYPANKALGFACKAFGSLDLEELAREGESAACFSFSEGEASGAVEELIGSGLCCDPECGMCQLEALCGFCRKAWIAGISGQAADGAAAQNACRQQPKAGGL